MIFVSHSLPVNVDDPVALGRHDVWEGLVRKANNALPFVPAMSQCEVLARHDEHVFDRCINFRGEEVTERITLEPEHRVVFTRLSGPVLGTIANEIEDHEGVLALRFSFALCVRGIHAGSSEETVYAESMTNDYLQAVQATLTAMRHLATATASPDSGTLPTS